MKLSRTWLRLTSIPWNALLHFPDEELRLLLCFFCKPSAAVQKCPRLALLTVKTNVCLTLELVLPPWCDKFSWLLKIKLVSCAIHLQFFNEISFWVSAFLPVGVFMIPSFRKSFFISLKLSFLQPVFSCLHQFATNRVELCKSSVIVHLKVLFSFASSEPDLLVKTKQSGLKYFSKSL